MPKPGGLVDSKHYFDTFADEAVYESRYHFPGWPVTIRGRASLMASLSLRNSTDNFCSDLIH